MAGSRAPAVFVFAVFAAVAGVAVMLRHSGTPGTPAPAPVAPPPKPAPPRPEPAPVEKPKPRKKPAEPPEPPIPSTPEGCLAFLKDQAGPARAPAAGVAIASFDEVRCAALDALVALDPAAAEPLVLQALSGDGDPNEWSSWRLHAAEIRIRAGKPDGAETLKAFLASDPEARLGEGAGAAARAAAWLPPDEGAGALRRLLEGGIDAFGEDEDLVAVFQSAATLGKGAAAGQVKKVYAEDAVFDATVLGSAAGALLRLGDASGKKALDRIEAEDEWLTEGAEFAVGLGARGNEAAIPWLERILKVEDESSRAGAVRALATIGTTATTPLLRAALKDEAEDVAAEAAVGLALRGDKDVLPLVRKAATSPFDELAIPAWRALALAADAESKAAAEKLLAEPSPGLRDVRRGPALLRRIEAALLILRVSK